MRLVGTATVSKESAASETETMRKMHNPDLPREQGSHSVVVRTVVIADLVKDLAYSYTFLANDEVPGTLGDIISSRPHAWDIQAMILLSIRYG